MLLVLLYTRSPYSLHLTQEILLERTLSRAWPDTVNIRYGHTELLS